MTLLSKASKAAVVSSAILVSFELALRLWWHPSLGPTEATLLAPHSERDWALDPNNPTSQGVRFRLGEHGLREARQSGADIRILTTGDSSIFGHGLVDGDTLHARLKRSLGSKDIEVDVLTAGVPGYTSTQTLSQLQEFGWEMELDLLVIGNLWSDSDFDVPEAERSRTDGDPMKSVGGAFRTLDFVRHILGRDSVEVGWITADAPVGPRRVSINDYALNLSTIFREAEMRGVGVALFTPCNRELAAREPSPPRGWPWEPYFQAANGVAQAHGVLVISGCEAAIAAGVEGDRGFLDEMHPTGLLNGVYAEAISRELISAGWPGERLLSVNSESELSFEDPWN
jgi:hypothetical protein